MKNLPAILKNNNYKKIKFKVLKTQHLLIKASINGIKGSFILDTGASNSCVGFESVELFQLNAGTSKTKATGAGATGMFTQLAKNNQLQLGSWKNNDFNLVIFDLTHVNAALIEHKVKPVQGIIGADILLLGEGIIDYYNRFLYLSLANSK
ncbi:retropepsin-like aspartic protease [Flavobacterium psychrotolerans]|uniref:Acid protease n=1 Tax=Flavobacterium psychrotolerans TaxID=2169410 RepID=A0A2U1JKU0_9FLAO|nr:retropepsin-like aspartic protease [Flavobacterium psychrotolerans]PWA05594.1 acid protease [Flavobacterium psychrotolerans]